VGIADSNVGHPILGYERGEALEVVKGFLVFLLEEECLTSSLVGVGVCREETNAVI
jgi:hypothetical protein